MTSKPKLYYIVYSLEKFNNSLSIKITAFNIYIFVNSISQPYGLKVFKRLIMH